jgi:hypothetical protein
VGILCGMWYVWYVVRQDIDDRGQTKFGGLRVCLGLVSGYRLETRAGVLKKKKKRENRKQHLAPVRRTASKWPNILYVGLQRPPTRNCNPHSHV